MTKNICRTTILLLILLIGLSASSQDHLSLNQAVEIAMANNFDIRIARNNLLIAKEETRAGNARLMPSLSAGLTTQNNINNSEQELYSGDTRQGNNVRSSGLNAGIQLGWTLFDGFDMFITREKLAELENGGEIQARVVVENVVLNTIMLYHAIALEQKKLEVTRQSLEISRERKKIAEQKQEIGSGSGSELLQAIVDLNADSSALLQQEYNLLNVMIMFNELLAREPDMKFVADENMQTRNDLTYDRLNTLIQEQNPDIALARSNLSIEQLALKQQRSSLYPSLTINSGYNYQLNTSEIGIIRYGVNNGVYYGLTASWTIFNGLTRNRNLEIAKIHISNSELELEQTNHRIRNELYNLYAEYLKGSAVLNAERKNLAVADENLKIAVEKMNLGTISSLELREAQRNKVSAEFRLIAAEYETKMAETKLRQLCGMPMY
jgi:outer membrane protein